METTCCVCNQEGRSFSKAQAKKPKDKRACQDCLAIEAQIIPWCNQQWILDAFKSLVLDPKNEGFSTWDSSLSLDAEKHNPQTQPFLVKIEVPHHNLKLCWTYPKSTRSKLVASDIAEDLLLHICKLHPSLPKTIKNEIQLKTQNDVILKLNTSWETASAEGLPKFTLAKPSNLTKEELTKGLMFLRKYQEPDNFVLMDRLISVAQRLAVQEGWLIDLYHNRVRLCSSEQHGPKCHQDIQHALALRPDDAFVWADKAKVEFFCRKFRSVEGSLEQAERFGMKSSNLSVLDHIQHMKTDIFSKHTTLFWSETNVVSTLGAEMIAKEVLTKIDEWTLIQFSRVSRLCNEIGLSNIAWQQACYHGEVKSWWESFSYPTLKQTSSYLQAWKAIKFYNDGLSAIPHSLPAHLGEPALFPGRFKKTENYHIYLNRLLKSMNEDPVFDPNFPDPYITPFGQFIKNLFFELRAQRATGHQELEIQVLQKFIELGAWPVSAVLFGPLDWALKCNKKHPAIPIITSWIVNEAPILSMRFVCFVAVGSLPNILGMLLANGIEHSDLRDHQGHTPLTKLVATRCTHIHNDDLYLRNGHEHEPDFSPEEDDTLIQLLSSGAPDDPGYMGIRPSEWIRFKSFRKSRARMKTTESGYRWRGPSHDIRHYAKFPASDVEYPNLLCSNCLVVYSEDPKRTKPVGEYHSGYWARELGAYAYSERYHHTCCQLYHDAHERYAKNMGCLKCVEHIPITEGWIAKEGWLLREKCPTNFKGW